LEQHKKIEKEALRDNSFDELVAMGDERMGDY